MYITRMRIKDFRNIEDIEFCPDRTMNVFFGRNAQGKTNLLEAIYYAANGSSFRPVHDRDLLRFDQDGLGVKLEYVLRGQANSMEISLSSGKRKKILVNNKSNFGLQDRIRATIFSPDDLYLIKGAPQKRRFFLDNLLKVISGEYKRNLEDYERLLQQRNHFLRSDRIDPGKLEALDFVFVATAAGILMARLNILKVLEQFTVDSYREIAGGNLRLKYALSFQLSPGRINQEIIKSSLMDSLAAARSREIRQKTTLIGPHRDDVNFYLDDKNARLYASQGQQRNIIVALKLAELETIKKALGSYPIFLLDEVLAELDEQTREKILHMIQEAPFQSFLTSVDVSLFQGINAKIVRVDNGRLFD